MNKKNFRFIASGKGFAGQYETRREAQDVIERNRSGAVYRREGPEISTEAIRELRDKASAGAMGIGDIIDLIDEIERLNSENADLRKTAD